MKVYEPGDCLDGAKCAVAQRHELAHLGDVVTHERVVVVRVEVPDVRDPVQAAVLPIIQPKA